MKRLYILLSIFLITVSISSGQGTIRGKITDENGEAIIGAVIMLKSNMSFGTITDLDGNYSLKISDSTAQTIIVSSIGLQKIEETVHPGNGQVLVKNFVLKSSSKEIKEVQVTAKAVKAKEYYMEKVKINSATTLDYISSETMKKRGDVSLTAAVARIPGVSTNGGFITVRGIGDRYVKTAINGSRIPTLDPFTNNIKLDLFPPSLVDNVLVTKTASPDLPGDGAGAYISVETKDYPDQLSVNAEMLVGYNNQSTFKDVVTSQRSSTDWLGYDNNFRDRSHDHFNSATITPTTYQEFVALGLESYYNSLGVNANTPWNDTYYKLGLVKLGLLAPAQFNDDIAFKNAKTIYINGSYKSEAFKVINSDVPETGKSLPDNWSVSYRSAPLNFGQNFSVGNQTQLFGKPLGYIFGYRYGSVIQYDGNSTTNRATQVDDGHGNPVRALSSSAVQQASRETNGWSMLMNLAYKLNPNHSVSLLFMPNLIGVNNVRFATDYGDIKNTILNQSQNYEQRRQLVYQFKSEHYIPGPKMKMELNASYTNGKSSTPDFKNIEYWRLPDSTYQIGGTIGNGIHRYYRYLSDNLFDSRLSAELPISKNHDLVRKLRFGGAYQRNDKKSDQYDYQVLTNNSIHMVNNNIDIPLSLDNFGIRTYTDNFGQEQSTIDLYYVMDNSAANHTFGKSEVITGFAMLDYAIVSRLRVSGGLRVEKANIYTDVYRYDSLGFAPNDPRRYYTTGLPLANPGKLDEIDYLPSANIIYKLKNNETAPINLRLNYSQTVARPSIRELSDVAVFDYEYRSFVYGNSALKTVHVNNYDLRVEDYFKSGDNVSVSFFYKEFKNHIELISSGGYSWINVDKSNVAGIELEGKKRLTKHFDLGANVAFINSNTKFVRTSIEIDGKGFRHYIPHDTVSRTMFGQAPYVLNGFITYTSDSIGLFVTLSYNVQGPRLVIASDNKEIPDVYELPRHLLDIKITKSLAKHFSVSLNVRDILNTPIRRAYKYPEGYSLDYDKYTYGTNYIFGITYKL